MSKQSAQIKELLWPSGPSQYCRQLCRLTVNGDVIETPRLPTSREIRRVDCIVGGSLHRMAYLSCSRRSIASLRRGSVITALVKTTTERQLQMCCDMCPGEQHRPSNTLCSASMGAQRSPFVFGVVYSATTKEPLFRFSINRCTIIEQNGGIFVCQFPLQPI